MLFPTQATLPAAKAETEAVTETTAAAQTIFPNIFITM
jgi:hypothetical protein